VRVVLGVVVLAGMLPACSLLLSTSLRRDQPMRDAGGEAPDVVVGADGGLPMEAGADAADAGQEVLLSEIDLASTPEALTCKVPADATVNAVPNEGLVMTMSLTTPDPIRCPLPGIKAPRVRIEADFRYAELPMDRADPRLRLSSVGFLTGVTLVNPRAPLPATGKVELGSYFRGSGTGSELVIDFDGDNGAGVGSAAGFASVRNITLTYEYVAEGGTARVTGDATVSQRTDSSKFDRIDLTSGIDPVFAASSFSGARGVTLRRMRVYQLP
jgi:hypothetical protein